MTEQPLVPLTIQITHGIVTNEQKTLYYSFIRFTVYVLNIKLSIAQLMIQYRQ